MYDTARAEVTTPLRHTKFMRMREINKARRKEMVSIEPIETKKENLAPSRKGYDIRLLSQNEIPTSSDPLEREFAEIEQVRHKHSQNAKSSKLIRKMAECIERFKDSLAHKNFLPYVRLCLDYGGYSDSPASIFEFMEANGIGKKTAEYFLHKANFLESRKRFAEAQAALQQGISSSAEPRSALHLELSDLRRRHELVKPRASQSRIPVIDVSKRRRLAIYVDRDEGEKLSSPIDSNVPCSLPRILTENKENKETAEPFVLSSRSISSTRRLEVYQDLEEDSETVLSLSYNEQAILYCEFPEPVRPFQPDVARSMVVHRAVSLGQPVMAGIYQQHGGVTEPIGNALLQRCGDTEIL